MTKPVVTQVISSTVAPSAPRRCGIATLTIDESMAPISVPKVTDSVTSHLLTGARASGARTRDGGRHAAASRGAHAARRRRRAGDRPRRSMSARLVEHDVADDERAHHAEEERRGASSAMPRAAARAPSRRPASSASRCGRRSRAWCRSACAPGRRERLLVAADLALQDDVEELAGAPRSGVSSAPAMRAQPFAQRPPAPAPPMAASMLADELGRAAPPAARRAAPRDPRSGCRACPPRRRPCAAIVVHVRGVQARLGEHLLGGGEDRLHRSSRGCARAASAAPPSRPSCL